MVVGCTCMRQATWERCVLRTPAKVFTWQGRVEVVATTTGSSWVVRCLHVVACLRRSPTQGTPLICGSISVLDGR